MNSVSEKDLWREMQNSSKSRINIKYCNYVIMLCGQFCIVSLD